MQVFHGSTPRNNGVPIFKLPSDVLWRIFMLNADLDDSLYWWMSGQSRQTYIKDKFENNLSKHPLTVARHTSHVCRNWRELMLSSSSIWGNLIDLELLRQPSDNWRKEIIKRTGWSPLDIRGDVKNKHSESFFLDLLKNHWKRTRRLEVRIPYAIESPVQELWHAFNRRAPNLEAFCFSFSGAYWSHTEGMSLFANDAPHIREFYSQNLAYNPSARWISQLRCLILSGPLSTQDLFLTLENTPRLQLLSLKRAYYIDHGSLSRTGSRKKISLPHLTTVVLKHDFRICLSLLETFEPSSSCDLNLDTTGNDISSEEVDAFLAALYPYTLQYSVAEDMTEFVLMIYYTSLTLFVRRSSGTTLTIHISTISETWIGLYSSLLDLFSSFRLCNVTDFTLALWQGVDGNRAEIISFLPSLSAVKTITVTENALSIDLLNQDSAILPSLHTVKLFLLEEIFPEDPDETPTYPLTLYSFLARRNDVGNSVKVLDLCERHPDALGDFGFLEELSGLTVKWSDRNWQVEEYTCGEGTPEKLNIRFNNSSIRTA